MWQIYEADEICSGRFVPKHAVKRMSQSHRHYNTKRVQRIIRCILEDKVYPGSNPIPRKQKWSKLGIRRRLCLENRTRGFISQPSRSAQGRVDPSFMFQPRAWGLSSVLPSMCCGIPREKSIGYGPGSLFIGLEGRVCSCELCGSITQALTVSYQ